MQGVQAVIDALAERLRRSVVVDDPLVRMLYASRHYGDEDEVRVRAVLQRDAGPAAVAHVLAQGVASWTGPGVVPPLPSIGMRARVCVPVRHRGRLVGLVLLVDADGSLTPGELDDARATADALAPLLDDEPPGTDAVLAEAVGDLLHGDPARSVAPLEGVLGAGALTGARVVLLRAVREGRAASGERVGTAARAALRDLGRGADRPVGAGRVDDGEATVVLAGGRRPPGRDEVAAVVGSLVATATSAQAEVGGEPVRWHAGISAPVGHADQVRAARPQAALAAGAVARLPTGGAVRWWEDLGALALLLALPAGTDARSALPDQVQRLLAVDPDGRLTATVRAYLDHGGNGPRSAAALHVHRTTLYYRLDRVAGLTGLDLADGPTRLALHAGLLALDLLER